MTRTYRFSAENSKWRHKANAIAPRNPIKTKTKDKQNRKCSIIFKKKKGFLYTEVIADDDPVVEHSSERE